MDQLFEGKNKNFTSQDIRFTKNNGNLYAFALVPPANGTLTVNYLKISVESIELLGYKGAIKFDQTADKLTIELPTNTRLKNTLVFKIQAEK